MEISVTPYPDYTELRLAGRFDRTATREFRDALIEALRASPQELRIDLGAVEYIDSSALGLLLMAREMAEKSGKTVVLAKAKGVVRQALDLTRFGSLFKIV